MAKHARELSTNVKKFNHPARYDESNLRNDYQIESENYGPKFEETHPLENYLRILLVHRKLILTVAITILVLTAIHSYTATPLYTAETDISIGSYSPTVQGTRFEDSLAKQTEKQDYLETQIKLISRLTLADKILSDPEVGEKIKEYLNRKSGSSNIISSIFKVFSSDKVGEEKIPAGTYENPIGLLKAYLTLVKIDPVKRTSLVKISSTTSNPELSALVANAHARNFIEITKEDKQRTALNNLVFLRGQAEELASKVSSTEQELAQYAEDNAIVAINQDEDIVVKKMGELNRLLTDATSKRISSETVYNEAKRGDGAETSENTSRGLEDLRARLRESEAEYANLGQKFKAEYPAMQQLRAKVDSIKNSIEQQGKIILKTAESKYNSDLATENQLKRELEIQKSKAFDLSKRSVKYNSIKREFDSVRDLHQSVLRQLKEAQISAESEINNISLADKAAVPQGPSSPKRARNLLLALLIGPILGVILALALEIIDNTLETPEEVQRVLQLPSLGVIPSFNSEAANSQPEDLKNLGIGTTSIPKALPEEVKESNQETDTSPTISTAPKDIIPLSSQIEVEHGLVTVHAPFSATSEAFRAVRTSILLSSADNPPRVVLVTSSKKGEGKTTLSSNLALTIAGTVRSAVVIDCDLRRSALHKMFNIERNSPGLVEYLTGQCPLENVIYKTTSEKLSVIPAGIKPPNPAELLGSHKMVELLKKLREQFEFVLIDSPPILPVTDSVILSRMVDGVVLVVRGQKTEQNIAKESRNRISHVGGKILGVILNGVDVKKGQHYYYYRDSYAEYYGDEKEEAKKNPLRFWS